MNEVWVEMIKQSPIAAALLLVVFFFLKHIRDAEAQRIANAKDMETERRAHELAINNMWAVNIKQLVDQMSNSHAEIVRLIEQHDKNDKERYERMGVTKDLLDAAKDAERRRK